MKKRFVVISDNPKIITGYARVGRFLAKTLCEAGNEVFYFPCNADVPDKEEEFPYTVMPFDQSDRYWTSRATSALRQIAPSLVIVIGEFNYVGYIGTLCRNLGLQSLYYLPVEGAYYPPVEFYAPGAGKVDVRLRLVKFNYIVAYSEFGKHEIHRILPGLVTAVIPHQVDTKLFRPLDKKKCLEIYIPKVVEQVGFEKLFMVGAFYRNHRRKGTDYLLRGFSKFLQYERRDYKTALLIALMDPHDAFGYNLEDLVERYGLRGRVVLIPQVAGREGIPDNGLAELYNAVDVHLCPFRAEGFGYNIIETLACGTRVIATKFATPAGYGEGVIDFIQPWDYEPLLNTNCDWAVLDVNAIASKLKELYEQNTKTVFQAGVDRAAEYSEERVADQWLKLLGELPIPDSVDVSELEAVANKEDILSSYLSALGG